jgi:acyl-CoA hydrolase
MYKSAGKALSVVQSGHRVFVQGSAQTPLYLLRELAKRAAELRRVELNFITLHGDIELDKPEYEDSFHINCMFVSQSVRQAVNEGRADYIPVFLSDIPDLFRRQMKIDVALVQVSPPDEHGYCSLGVSVDIARSAVNTATHIIAQINPRVPRTHGDSLVHTRRFSSMVYYEEELPELDYGAKVGIDEL